MRRSATRRSSRIKGILSSERDRRPAALHHGSPHLGCRYRLVLLADDNVDQALRREEGR
jgi:hypothetical protein